MSETFEPVESDYAWFSDSLERRPTKRRNLTIPEHAETTTIPTGKYRGVKFNNDRAPYMIRPMELLGPASNIQEVRCMFPAQTGKSTIGEQTVLYYIQEVPSEILYITSDERQAKKWLDKRIAPRVNKLGVEFRAQVAEKGSKRSGDTMLAKEFDGGNLDAASSRSPAQLASETKRLVIADETDRWKQSLGAEGFVWDIVYARTQAWGDQKKILAISTPTTYDESLIWPLFEEGTREEYFIPCPHCGEYQILKIENLTYVVEHGSIKDNKVWYSCCNCGESIYESHKYDFLLAGEWRAQGTPISDSIVSFHINAIYSPFKDWIEIAREYEKAKNDPVRMHTFNNLVLGMPHRETGSRPQVKKIMDSRGTYKSGEVPNAVLFLTGAADVQRGRVTYAQFTDEELEQEMNHMVQEGKDLWHQGLPRIELEIMGHSSGYRTFSIEYKVFYGHTHNATSGAWEKLRLWLEEKRLTYQYIDGNPIECSVVLIDSGDGQGTATVYEFCEPYPGVFPCKGDQNIKKTLKDRGDEINAGTFKRYTKTRIGEAQHLINVSTNFYKSKIYKNIKIARIDAEIQRPGFIETPRDYSDWYFSMLTAEEQRSDGSFHAGGRRNEVLDVQVYNLAASELYIDSLIVNRRELLIKNGASKTQATNMFNVKEAYQLLKSNRDRQRIKESA